VKAIAALFDVDRNTVRGWVRNGLTPIDDAKPIVIHGLALKAYLDQRQSDRKTRCGDGEMFCPKCRASQRLLPGSFYFEATNTLRLIAKAKCYCCRTQMTRLDVTANREKLSRLFGYARKNSE
jgi:hypothetical protein